MADDALNTDKMNAGPGGKQPVMRDTIREGKVQKMVNENGIPKGMRLILEERGVNTEGMNVKQMRETLKSHSDFKYQKCKLENYIEQRVYSIQSIIVSSVRLSGCGANQNNLHGHMPMEQYPDFVK